MRERKQNENIKSTNLLTFFFLIRFILFDCSRYWILKYDTSIWRDFVVCYNAPGFPILVLQLFTDEFVAKRVGTRGVCLLHLFLISWLDLGNVQFVVCCFIIFLIFIILGLHSANVLCSCCHRCSHWCCASYATSYVHTQGHDSMLPSLSLP